MADGPTWFLTHEFAPFRGGAATYVRETAGAARGLGFDVRVLAPAYPRHQPTVATDGEPAEAAVSRFAGNGRLNPAGIVEMAAGIWRHRQRLDGAPLVAGSAGALMALILLDRSGLFRPHRLVCFLHGSEILKLRRRPFWWALAPGFFRRWPQVAVASRYVRGLWETAALVPPGGAAPLLAPCACPGIFLERARTAAAAAVHLDRGVDDDLDVLTVARLHPRKGQVHVARALGLLPASLRQRVRYVVAGTGPESYRRELANACAGAGVRLVGPRPISEPDLATVYAGAAVYAQASISMPESVEGFGITYLEAAACSLPTAAWDSGGTGEAVLDGRTGLLSPEGDVEGLAASLRRLLEDGALRTRLGRAGQEHAWSFRWETSARTLVEAARVAFPRR